MNATTLSKSGILYPLLVTAAISVILVSLIGVATMTGLIPSAMSKSEIGTRNNLAAIANACNNCGVIQSVRAAEIKGSGSGIGAVTGGITGALVGNELGSGRGRTALTLLGAGGGAYVGNEIEKKVNRSVRYQVRVRMNDGTRRTFYENQLPDWRAGDKVKIENGSLVRYS